MTSDKVLITVVGNCQSKPIAECVGAMVPQATVNAAYSREIRSNVVDLDAMLAESDVVLVQTCMRKTVDASLDASGRRRPEVVMLPTIFYSGYHPDIVYADYDKGLLSNPLGHSNSAIALFGWLNGLGVEEILSLYNDRTYEQLGYHDYKTLADDQLLGEASSLGFDLGDELREWGRGGCFMYNANHPHLRVMAGLARAGLAKAGIERSMHRPENYLLDKLAAGPVWPIYPELGARTGMSGEYVFKVNQVAGSGAPRVFHLDEFVRGAVAAYEALDPELISCTRFEADDRYAKLLRDRARPGHHSAGSRHPYKGLPDYHFWHKAVATPAVADVDPVVAPRTVITPDMRIATGGSCFAQHIAKALSRSGFNYYVEETGAGLDPQERSDRQYGVYSARYGNLYTTAQLNQLFDRAFGHFRPVDVAWKRSDGRFVDPFRPQIEPRGFGSVEDVVRSRDAHLEAVRAMFEKLDLFVFTLGLTEAWRSRRDGAVLPLAPGVAGGDMDPARYEFHNFSAEETVDQARDFIRKLREINPRAKIILTVSPVPLAATYEERHVLVATCYSKAALRVAAQTLSATVPDVEYFPSFEIITGAYNRGSYFEDDLRNVTAEGVDHVMGVFLRHHTTRDVPATKASYPDALRREFAEGQGVVCEEEALTRLD